MDDIAIKIVKLNFDRDIQEQLNKFSNTYRLKVKYYYGYIIKFNNVNVDAITPHRIVFSKYGYDLIVLYYDEYHENNNLFIIVGKGKRFNISTMKKYIKEYFSMIYKINKYTNSRTKIGDLNLI